MCISKFTVSGANFKKLENTVNGILKTVNVLKTKVEQLETRQKSLFLWKEKQERTIYHQEKKGLPHSGYN